MEDGRAEQVRQLLAEGFGGAGRGTQVFEDLCCADMLFTAPERTCVGRAELKAHVADVQRAFEGFQVEVRYVIAEGDRAVARITVQGRQIAQYNKVSAQNQRVSIEELVEVRFADDGRICDVRCFYDASVLTSQLRSDPGSWRH